MQQPDASVFEPGPKRKRYILLIVAFAIGIPAILITCRLTHIYGFYTVPTPSNFPTIKPGDYIFASRLISPERNKFICFHAENQIYVSRLCGMGGDIIEIRDGDLFVNGLPADIGLTLAHVYIMTGEDFLKLDKSDVDESIHQATPDSTTVCVSDEAIRRLSLAARRLVMPAGYRDEMIGEKYSADWNADQFGPVVVPKGKYFLLGDSRHNSLDSRYRGFIDQSDYVSTVLGH